MAELVVYVEQHREPISVCLKSGLHWHWTHLDSAGRWTTIQRNFDAGGSGVIVTNEFRSWVHGDR